MKWKQTGIVAAGLAAVLLLAGCSQKLSGSRMWLTGYRNAVLVLNEQAKEQKLKEGMTLGDRFRVETDADSNAWITISDQKDKEVVTDENTVVSIKYSDEKLVMTLKEGSFLYYNTAPETITSTTRFDNCIAAYMGTAAINKRISDTESVVIMLEGSAALYEADGRNRMKGTDGEELDLIETGMAAEIVQSEQGKTEITVREIVQEDIPDFVWDEIEQKEELSDLILENGGTLDYPTREELEERLAGEQEVVKADATETGADSKEESGETETAATEPEIDFVGIFEENFGTLRRMYIADFDGDGKKEAFGFGGEITDSWRDPSGQYSGYDTYDDPYIVYIASDGSVPKDAGRMGAMLFRHPEMTVIEEPDNDGMLVSIGQGCKILTVSDPWSVCLTGFVVVNGIGQEAYCPVGYSSLSLTDNGVIIAGATDGGPEYNHNLEYDPASGSFYETSRQPGRLVE